MAEYATDGAAAGVDPSNDKALKRFLERFERAKKIRELNNTILDDCYKFALPLRERPFGTGGDGKPDTDELFDGTAPRALQDLASQMLDDVWPADAKPFELAAGPDIDRPDVPRDVVDEANKILAGVTDDVIETVNNSNFRSEAHEALMDWGIGEGFLLPEQGDALDPVRFRCLPLPDAYPATGPFGQTDGLFRPRRVKAGDIKTVWPSATLNEELEKCAADNPDKEHELIEGVERDWSRRGTETWNWRVVDPKSKHTVYTAKSEGDGSKPFIDFSFMRVAGETIGRGPVMIALPDIKTLNLAKQFILENADLAVGGVYQADDDGTVNFETLSLDPRTVIPRAPGTKGLEPLQAAGDFSVADLLIERLQMQIESTMFGSDLGPAVGTPMSATEVLQRTSDRARRRAGPYQRLIGELLFQTVRAVVYIRTKQNRIKLPRIDGRAVRIRALAPITRAQAQDEILRFDRYMEMMLARQGPQQTAILIDGEEAGRWLAAKMGVEPRLVRSRVAAKQMQQAIAAMQAMAAATGGKAAA